MQGRLISPMPGNNQTGARGYLDRLPPALGLDHPCQQFHLILWMVVRILWVWFQFLQGNYLVESTKDRDIPGHAFSIFFSWVMSWFRPPGYSKGPPRLETKWPGKNFHKLGDFWARKHHRRHLASKEPIHFPLSPSWWPPARFFFITGVLSYLHNQTRSQGKLGP